MNLMRASIPGFFTDRRFMEYFQVHSDCVM